ncbi:hypothetical protein HK100_012249, partial [Physocladia obscura]
LFRLTMDWLRQSVAEIKGMVIDGWPKKVEGKKLKINENADLVRNGVGAEMIVSNSGVRLNMSGFGGLWEFEADGGRV